MLTNLNVQLAPISTVSITGAFFLKEDNYVQDKPGMIQNADAVLMIKPGVSITKDDKLTYDILLVYLGYEPFYHKGFLFYC